MSLTNVTHIDNENDDVNDDGANQPLLQSSSSTSKLTKSTTTIVKLPNATNQTKRDNEHRILLKIVRLATNKLNRIKYIRRLNRDKWNRIEFVIFTILFLSMVCFFLMIDPNFEKPSIKQIVVDVPPLDTNLLGQKGKILSWLNASD